MLAPHFPALSGLFSPNPLPSSLEGYFPGARPGSRCAPLCLHRQHAATRESERPVLSSLFVRRGGAPLLRFVSAIGTLDDALSCTLRSCEWRCRERRSCSACKRRVHGQGGHLAARTAVAESSGSPGSRFKAQVARIEVRTQSGTFETLKLSLRASALQPTRARADGISITYICAQGTV